MFTPPPACGTNAFQGGAADGEIGAIGAITLFGNLMDYHGALQRYSLQIKGRYIEVRSFRVEVGDEAASSTSYAICDQSSHRWNLNIIRFRLP